MIGFRHLRPLLVGACLAAFGHAAWAQSATDNTLIPLKSFAQHPRVYSPSLSPDGKYLAVRMDDADGKHHAIVTY